MVGHIGGMASGMMGRDIVAVLKADARTKPHLAALIEQASDMGDDEFELLATPMPWVKNALREMRKRKAQEAAQGTAQEYADTMGEATHNSPQTGIVARYTGEDRSIPTRGMAIDIKNGELLFLTANDAWLGSIALGKPDIPCEIVERNVTRGKYFEMVNRLISPAAPVENGGLFRITRI